jgi:putative tryptophan/tyrosine transport system substrate-binding protein
MKRRAFLGLLGGAAALPLAARAQQPERVRRIAILAYTNESDPDTQRRIASFRRGLSALGWIEGRNLEIAFRSGRGNDEAVRSHARQLVEAGTEVILTNGTPATTAIKRATSSIPVVFAMVTDPVGDGLVDSLARPGQNVTGFAAFESEIGGKWIELLREAVPGLERAALLFNPRTVPGGGTRLMRPHFDAAARALGVEPIPVPVESAGDIERTLNAHAARGRAGLVGMPDGFLFVNGALVVRLASELRLPAIFPFRHFADLGALMTYGVDSGDLNLRAASYVDRILRGERPADLPVQAPTQYELVINMKTSKVLGIELPPTLLARADEVIE